MSDMGIHYEHVRLAVGLLFFDDYVMKSARIRDEQLLGLYSIPGDISGLVRSTATGSELTPSIP